MILKLWTICSRFHGHRRICFQSFFTAIIPFILPKLGSMMYCHHNFENMVNHIIWSILIGNDQVFIINRNCTVQNSNTNFLCFSSKRYLWSMIFLSSSGDLNRCIKMVILSITEKSWMSLIRSYLYISQWRIFSDCLLGRWRIWARKALPLWCPKRAQLP